MAPLGLKAIVGESKIFFVYYFIWSIRVGSSSRVLFLFKLTSGLKLSANVKCDTGVVKLRLLKGYSLSATLSLRLLWRKDSLAHSDTFIFIYYIFYLFLESSMRKGRTDPTDGAWKIMSPGSDP